VCKPSSSFPYNECEWRMLKREFCQKLTFYHHLLIFFCVQQKKETHNLQVWNNLRIFPNMLVTKQLTAAIDFHNRKTNTIDVNGYCQLFGYQHFLKCLLLCSTKERNTYRFGKVNSSSSPINQIIV